MKKRAAKAKTPKPDAATTAAAGAVVANALPNEAETVATLLQGLSPARRRALRTFAATGDLPPKDSSKQSLCETVGTMAMLLCAYRPDIRRGLSLVDVAQRVRAWLRIELSIRTRSASLSSMVKEMLAP